MPCSTCERRRTHCDESRPRCSTCARVHLKCIYNGPPRTFSFQDETNLVTGRTSTPVSKRRKVKAADHGELEPQEEVGNEAPPLSTTFNAPPESLPLSWQLGLETGQDWATSFDMMPNSDLAASDFAAWDQGFYAELLANTSPGQMLPQTGVSPESLDLHTPLVQTNPQKEPAVPAATTNGPPSLLHPQPMGENSSGTQSSTLTSRAGDPSEIPEHILAQHYSLNAIHRPDSKNWNFYMHFYNRFATSHPPVLSAIYASASAQLLYANKLGSMACSLSHYNSCMKKLTDLYSFKLPDAPSRTMESFMMSLRKLNQESMDVIIISLYFLALFDLTTTRPVHLRRILHAMPMIIRTRPQNERSGTFQRLSTWFLFLDVRASLFGLGTNEAILYTVGDEPELAEAVAASQNVLQEEYSFLYPEEERARDKLSLPLILRILEIMVIFKEISQHTASADDSTKTFIRQKIEYQKKELDKIDETSAKAAKLTLYCYTIICLHHAVEIYYCRTFNPTHPLYSCNSHAVTILTLTEKMHRTLGKSEGTTPHSKAWPIPLILATIEVQDPIHRSWGLRKFHDYRRAGNHYVRSYGFVEKICGIEETGGVRVDLGSVMRGMGEEFIV